jgi:uncharacterized damage-inducible protein DinB
MTDNILVKIFEHNNWANQQIIQVCSALSDAQLDTEPQSATKGSLRLTLTHLVNSQRNYLAILTLPVEARSDAQPAFAELAESARRSGEGLLALAKGAPAEPLSQQLQTRDGYYVSPWVIMLQAINHASEHREQINSMLTALGLIPPDLDGWTFGAADGALVPMPKR